MSENQTDQLDDILDETLDDLADLPSSKPFPAGAHAVKFFLTRPDAKKPKTYLAKFKYVDAIELSNPTDEPAKADDEAVMFIHTVKKDGTPNEFGQGQLKQMLQPFVEIVGSNKLSDMLAHLKNGVDAAIVSGVKKGNKEYPNDQMTLTEIKPL
jgi:hypothetical protein